MRFVVAFVPVLALSACGSSPETPPLIVQCSGERPQVCTMEYDPVCAEQVTGGRQTYSSPCNACADDAVTGYLRGACPE